MCFTPTISLTTTIIEFAIATFILTFYRKSLVNRFFVILIYVLGAYQFTEFMLCVSNNPILWARLGFIVYTFLPAIAIYYILLYSKKINNKQYFKLVYLIPIFFSVIAFYFGSFISRAECSQFFVIGQNMLYSISPILSAFYGLYYYGAIILSAIFILKKAFNEKNKIKKYIAINIFLALMVSLVPALILIIILPAISIMFPSIYCEFAILFSIAALIAARLDNQLKK